MSEENYPYSSNAIFWVEVEKIKPNPLQPRKDFDEVRLRELADSIRQYGVLQPLIVTRQEIEREDGGIVVEYELIAGERRLRASKIACISQVPVIIRQGEDSDRTKLEMAIIENIQREDLNPLEKARAFHKLANEFKFTHTDIGKKIGKSREYVSNTCRLLGLPEIILTSLSKGEISEGHCRPLLMLSERPEQQETLYKEIVGRRITVRDAEKAARQIAVERARKKDVRDPLLKELEEKLAERLGLRVHIEPKEVGGKLVIDFFNRDDLSRFFEIFAEKQIDIGSSDDIAPPTREIDGASQGEEMYSVKNFSI